MSKKNFILPKILMMEGGGDGQVIGGGTGQGGVVVITQPIGFDVWFSDPEYKKDHVEDGIIDINDYAAWWGGMMVIAPDVFTQEAWETLNADYDWDDFFG